MNIYSQQRTELEKDANSADCDLYKLIRRVERMETSKHASLRGALMHLRSARIDIRALMHPADKRGTEG